MGLKCSLLGHAFEPAGVERDREEQDSEVVTVVRELEECRRCGDERVVSETTEVTAVVDADEVEGDVDESDAPAGGVGGAVDRAEVPAEGDTDPDAEDPAASESPEDGPQPPEGAADAASEAADEAAAAVDELAEEPGEADAAAPEPTFERRAPEEEDAEILTDEPEPERAPGEWPDDAGPEDETDADAPPVDLGDEASTEGDEPDEESLSGITVPEGAILCPNCGFEVDAESSYRDGDPCPECGAWLTTEAER